MLCGKCKTQVVSGGKFCTKCGSSVLQQSNQSQWTEFAKMVYRDIKKYGTFMGKQAATTISPAIARNAKRISATPFVCHVFIRIGDGSVNYDHSAAAMYNIGDNIGRGRSNAFLAYNIAQGINFLRAKKNAQPHWKECERGTLIVTDGGLIILSDSEGIKTVDYSLFVSAKMSQWNCVEFDYLNKDNKTTKFAFTSDNALVAFACYCLKRDPNHYQLNDIFGGI